MKPSARLRTRPRSASESETNDRPSTTTSPAVGASSPPIRCSSVLLPEPEAPTMAMRSPAMHVEIHAHQHGDVLRAAGVGLGEPAAGEHGGRGRAAGPTADAPHS